MISLGQQLAENIRIRDEQIAAEKRAAEEALQAKRAKTVKDLKNFHDVVVSKIIDQIMSGNTSIAFKLTSVQTCGRARSIYESVCLHQTALKATSHNRDLADIQSEVIEAVNRLLEWGSANDLEIRFTTDHDGGGMRSWGIIEAVVG